MDQLQRRTVHVAGAVSVVEGFQDLGGNVHDQAGVHGAASRVGEGAQVLARHQFHREVIALADEPNVKDLADVAMVELDNDAGLVDEPGHILPVVGQMRAQRLDDAVLFETGDTGHAAAAGQKDLAHAALGNRRQQQIGPEVPR